MQLRFFLAASVAAIPLAVGISLPAMAQQITTGIEGRVTDENGQPIAGATVVVTDTRTGAARTLTTSGDGSFIIGNLVTGGPYKVSADAEGFEGQTLDGVSTTLQGNTSIDFTLTSGTGMIVVSAERVRIATVAVGPGTSFNAELLETTPSFNRDVRDVIRLDPRVSLDRDDTGSGQDRVSCLGGNDRGNAFTVDGISQGDIYGLNDTGFSSRSSTPIPYDAVRETQVVFAPFDVQYGQFTGCAINVVTKSGSNKFHGGGFYEYSDNGLRGDVVEGRPVAPIKPDKRWGVNLSGPIIPDRLFFFGAFERQESGQSQDDGPVGGGYANTMPQVTVAQFNQISEVLKRVYGIDTGGLVTSRPYKNDRYFGRLDWQISDQHRFEATYQRLEESTLKSDDLATTGTFAGTVVGRNTFYLSGTKSNYYSGRIYSDWNDALSTELYYARSEVRDLQDPAGGGEAQSGSPIPRIVVGIDNPTGLADGAVEGGPGFSRSANDLRTNIDLFRASATINAGDHKLKIGAEYNRANLYNLFVQNATATLVFRNVADLEAGLVTTGTSTTNSPANAVSGSAFGIFGNFSATGDINDAAARFKREIFSVYAQDDWTINDRLTATLGLRVDWYDGGRPELNPNFVARYGIGNNTGFSNIDPTIMPRLALRYDAGDFAVFSRAHITGGLGVFSGGDPLVWFGNAFQNDGSTFALGTSRGTGCPAQIDVVTNGQFTGIPACVVAQGQASASRGLGNTQSIDPDIKMPTVLRANIGFDADLDFAETGFFSGWHLNLDYIYSKYINPFNVQDLSQTVDLRKGVAGYAIDGRPIYVTIDPTNAGCSAVYAGNDPVPTFTGLTAANFASCVTTSRFDELQLTNAGSYRSHLASFILSKNWDQGIITDGGSVGFTFGYAYTDAQDRRNMYNSTAGSNYDNSAAFDRQNPAASSGFFGSKHNITMSLQFKEEFFGDYDTRLGFSFVARSGRPYSLTFSGGGVFSNSNSGTDNALVYLPTGVSDPNIAPTSNMTAVQDLVNFANSLGCAKKYIGKTVPRNSCSNDWYYDLDLSFSQELPGPGSFFGYDDKIRLYATMDNFLNFLDSGWNIQHRRDFAGRQDIAGTSGVDAQGRYIITNVNGLGTFTSDEFVNVSSSVWRLKIGVSYAF